MSDSNVATPLTSRRRWIWPGLLAAFGLTALVAGLALSPISAAARAGFLGGHGEHDPESMREHIDFAADWVLGRIDASEDQTQKVKEILERTLLDLLDLRADHETVREAFVAELTSPVVNREAIEKLRLEQAERFEVASRRIVSAVADVAEVLSPEQRLQLVEMAERFHGRRHGRRHAWHR